MRDLQKGSRLKNRYLLIKKIGMGGMSLVWLAHDEQTDQKVAIKLLKEDLAKKSFYKNLFNQEWKHGKKLVHPNIARVYDFYESEEKIFYTLQYINGPEVGVLSNAQLRNAIEPFMLIAAAIEYAHKKNIVHQDIKGSNILLDQDGVPYVLDFGVASTNNGDQPTPFFDDIYSLGVLLHEILMGLPPLDNRFSEVTKRPNGELISKPIVDLLRNMLLAEPENRPSVENMLDIFLRAGFIGRPANLKKIKATKEVLPEEVLSKINPIDTQYRRNTFQKNPSLNKFDDQGISRKTVIRGLSFLLVLFITVVFILPSVIENNSDVEESLEVDPKIINDLSKEINVSPSRENNQSAENKQDLNIKIETDEILGDFLSKLQRLEYRGIKKWGGKSYSDAMNLYSEGDAAYIDKDYLKARAKYNNATLILDQLFDRIEIELQKNIDSGIDAFEKGNYLDAIRFYDLAHSISPDDLIIKESLDRSLNLETVLSLMKEGSNFVITENFDAAKITYEKVLQIDAKWKPATIALAKVNRAINRISFEMRMSEGFEAINIGDFESARAAFNAAEKYNPQSKEPNDGLLQVNQELRLIRIKELEIEAQHQENTEQWEIAISTYQAILGLDSDLQFAKEGLLRSSKRAALHLQLQDFIEEPDSLSESVVIMKATNLLSEVSVIESGPRLTSQKLELSQLLKRAATPLKVKLISDNLTYVSINKVGRLGNFSDHMINLKPGLYIATGRRIGYRDVRVEFRVAPEIEEKPIIIRCEEPI
jgi:serine/threonine protein kinase